MTAENAAALGDHARPAGGFNEAAADDRGKRNLTPKKGTP